MTTDSSIFWFQEVGRESVHLVGGKGANLGELTNAGIPVPPGFIVSAPTYHVFIREAGLESQIRMQLHFLDVEDTQELARRSEAIKSLINGTEMPRKIATDIILAYKQFGEGAVAVRSSATAEDLPEASFAGQQSTFLNVVGANNVVDAVKACWASLWEARAIYYREKQNYDHMKVGIAVPVQRMVQSEKSGVMFTVEPVRRDPNKITIEAVYGLGEAIVSGEVSPDLYIIEKGTFEIVEKTVVPQTRMLVKNPKANGHREDANIWVEVPEELINEQKLNDEQILELAHVGWITQQHYESHQDIEWAYEGGSFFLTQARPVTTMGQAQSDESQMPHFEDRVFLSGSPASPGIGVGRVRVVLDPKDIDIVELGDVLVSSMTTPDFVPAMKRASAIITERGGRTCHAAIVSRELGLPCVVGAIGALEKLSMNTDLIVTVNGSDGSVYKDEIPELVEWYAKERERLAAVGSMETTTKLYVNLAEPELAESVAKRNVDGVGLLRAEFIVAQIGKHPRQFLEEGRGHEYTDQLAEGIFAFCQAFNPRPVVYRLTDFKSNEYANLKGGERYEKHEENPMIGYRGASRYIHEPEIFALELMAIKKVLEKFNNLYVMVPFVRTPEELRGVKRLMAEAGLVRDIDGGIEGFKIWMMCEVPSNVINLEGFIDAGIDGISIGSNDLTQLILGVDRDSETLSETFSEMDKAVMMAIEYVVKTARSRGITVGICGQGPSVYPEMTEKLVEWGNTSVSVSPDMIEQTRKIIAEAEKRIGISQPV